MTILKTTVVLDATCSLTVTDTTGFYDSVANPNGFLPESDTSTIVADTYKISNGYFINIINYNGYNVTPTMLNTTESWYTPETVSTTYSNNFTPTKYNMNNDGTYTVKRVFMISDVYYNAHKTGPLFNGKTIYYTDGIDVYLVGDGGVATIVTLSAFANASLAATTTLVSSTTFITTCQLDNCYYKLMSKILDLGLTDCASLPLLRRDRDFIYMTLETIKYLQDFNNTTQIQKLIEGVQSCGICGGSSSTVKDCGCHD